MKTSYPDRPARPVLRLRIGVTGARSLPPAPEQVDRLREQIRYVLELSKNAICHLHLERNVAEWYADAEAGKPCPGMQMLSPLARGADRLVAEAALDLDYDLYVPMPFPQEEYERDFVGTKVTDQELQVTAEEDLRGFRRLMEQASGRFELDGSRENPAFENRSYEAAGRFVVRHSNLLIGVWDGGPGKGRGGTAEIVHYAANAGVPVWWIDVNGKEAPRWVSDIADLRDPVPARETPEECLRRYLDQLTVPRQAIGRESEGLMERIAFGPRTRRLSPVASYYVERRLPTGGIWKTHAGLIKWASKPRKAQDKTLESTPPAPEQIPDSEDAVSVYWHRHYECADVLAGQYAARYRSTYVLVIFIATLALVFGASALWLVVNKIEGYSICMAALELLALALIVVLVVGSLRHEWHARSIEYRLLAELYRKQETLAPLGWSVPLGNVQHMTDTGRLAWVAWLFSAVQRAGPLPAGRVPDPAASKRRLEHLIEEQLHYHDGRHNRTTNAEQTFERLGSRVFMVVIACVVVKIGLEMFKWLNELPDSTVMDGTIVALGLLAAVLPGVSAALVGIRRYAELELLAEQSRHMRVELRGALSRVKRLNLNRGLVSLDLGAEAAAVATLMLQDLEGWGRLFRGKLMEAG